MEFNFQSKSTDGKTSISERPENINVIGNEEFDVVIKNDGLVNIYNLRAIKEAQLFGKLSKATLILTCLTKQVV